MFKNKFMIILGVLLLIGTGIYTGLKLTTFSPPPASHDFIGKGKKIKLPEPAYKSDVSIEEALGKRRTVRNYADQPVRLEELGQLLWAAQGVTDKEKGLRTAPSAFSVYPLKVYVVADRIEGLPAGFYGYSPEDHALVGINPYNLKNRIFLAVKQPSVKRASGLIIIAGRYEEMQEKLGNKEMARFCVHAEAGHIAQNIYLQTVSLGLGTVSIGGFDDEEMVKILGLNKNEDIFYIMPVGKLEQ